MLSSSLNLSIRKTTGYNNKILINNIGRKLRFTIKNLPNLDKWSPVTLLEPHVPAESYTAQNQSFPIRISSAYVTKSVGSGRFGHIYWRNP